MFEELNIFDCLYDNYKINKPIKLIELFAGYGSQALALKYLGANFEHWRICEWAVKSIQAYKDIHFTDDNNDYSKSLSDSEIYDYLYNLGISSNYNEPMSFDQIRRLGSTKARTVYNNIKATHNLVNIQKARGKDFEIKDDGYCYIMTYSFPCQDLSLAGKRKGMADTSTRSGMLWEVERILNEMDVKPDVLLMENVIQVHSKDNIEHFNKWQRALEQMGYKNYWKDMIATDYGIPQTRNRTFMVSVKVDYNYNFPKKRELKLKLKDLLETDVNQKYYLTDAMIKCFTRESDGDKFPRGERFQSALKLTNEKGIAGTITTAAGNRATDNFIIVKNATKKGYLFWGDGDGIDVSKKNGSP